LFQADDHKIVSLGAEGSLFVWGIESDFAVVIVSKRRLDEEDFDKPKNRFQNITSAAYNGNVLVAVFADGVFKTYIIANDSTNVFASATVTFSHDRVTSVAISTKYAAITSEKLGELVVWDLDKWQCCPADGLSLLAVWPVLTTHRTALSLQRVATIASSKSGTSKRAPALRLFKTITVTITDVRFGESGRTVITSSYDGTCRAFRRCWRSLLPHLLPSAVELTTLAIDLSPPIIDVTFSMVYSQPNSSKPSPATPPPGVSSACVQRHRQARLRIVGRHRPRLGLPRPPPRSSVSV
jgi:hypothetical protein